MTIIHTTAVTSQETVGKAITAHRPIMVEAVLTLPDHLELTA